MRGVALWAVVALLCAVPVAAATDAEIEGLQAFVAGRFDEAAVGLKQSIRDHAQPADAKEGPVVRVSGQTAYFLGRSFQELGLRGLALHYLGQAELYGTPEWRLLARRELTQLYFEATDYAAVMQVIDRMRSEPPDPEIHYFAGLAAAGLRAWPQSIEMLGHVPPSSGYYAYARYARAQTGAANGDVAGALADLDEVIARAKDQAPPRTILTLFSSSNGRPVALLEQARVLRGKILYAEGHDAEARASFAAVGGGGRAGLEAVRGLLLTGAGVDSASRVEVSPSRPVDKGALLSVRALAAEESGDIDSARRIRSEVRELAKQRLAALDRLATDPAAESLLERDLAEFWQRLRRERWRLRWEQEEPSLSKEASGVGSPSAGSNDSFVPKDGIFYGVWDQARTNAWLSGLIELRASADTLARDIEAAPQRGSIWKFWRRDEIRRLADALLVIRVANLRQRLADHLHNFTGLGENEYKGRKRQAVEDGIAMLGRLYLGPEPKIPELLVNLDKGLEYKRFDMFRLVDAVPERATDPVISLAGNYVDLLADLRARLAQGGEAVPKATAEGPEILEKLQAANQALTREMSGFIRKASEPTRRAQVAFFTRMEADNERSLARLYGRAGGEKKEKK
jgi:hypothetical protein